MTKALRWLPLSDRDRARACRCVLHNPRSDMRREWFWEPEPFCDRIGRMRAVWAKWMLEQIMVSAPLTYHCPALHPPNALMSP